MRFTPRRGHSIHIRHTQNIYRNGKHELKTIRERRGAIISPLDQASATLAPVLHLWKNLHFLSLDCSAAKLAALSWDPENMKKLSLNAYLQIFATKMPYLQIFATKMPYLQVFATKIALLNYMTKTQCLALILSVQDKINQLIANLFY